MTSAAENKRALQLQIRDVLLQDWDPIGIKQMPDAQDEYDEYVPEIYDLLMGSKPVGDILDVLLRIEEHHMGLPADWQHTSSIACRLFSLRSTG